MKGGGVILWIKTHSGNFCFERPAQNCTNMLVHTEHLKFSVASKFSKYRAFVVSFLSILKSYINGLYMRWYRIPSCLFKKQIGLWGMIGLGVRIHSPPMQGIGLKFNISMNASICTLSCMISFSAWISVAMSVIDVKIMWISSCLC